MSHPSPDPYRANIPRFYIYRVLNGFALWAPIWVVYLIEKRGLSFTQLTLLDAPFWLVAALSEVPTGAVADIYGRKTSVGIGVFLYSFALLVFGFADSYFLILASYLLWALSNSFISGAETAFLYDSLKAMGREGEFTRVNGRAMSLSQVSWAVSSLLGAPLGAIDLSLPIYLSALFVLGSLAVVITFREPPRFAEHRGEGYWSTMASAFRVALRQPTVRYATLYGVSLSAMGMMIIGIFFQPYVLERGVALPWLGVAALILVRIPGLGGAELADRVAKRVGEKRELLLLPIGVTLATILMAATPGWGGLVFLPFVAFFFWVPRPILDTIVNRELPSHLRATVISVQAFVFALLALVVEPSLGYLSDLAGLPFAILVLALAGGGVLYLILALWNRHPIIEERQLASAANLGDPPAEES